MHKKRVVNIINYRNDIVRNLKYYKFNISLTNNIIQYKDRRVTIFQ